MAAAQAGTDCDDGFGYPNLFPGADLHDCLFFNVDFTGTDFSGQDLTGSTFEFSGGDGATFDGATLTGVSFTHSNFADSSFVGADLTDGAVRSSTWTNADLTGANMTRFDFARSGFPSGTFGPYGLPGADLSGADLTDASFFGVDLREVTLVGTVFDGTVCPNGDLSVNGSCLDDEPGDDELAGMGVNCLDTTPVPAVGGKYFNCDARSVGAAWFRGADLEYADFAGAVIDGADLTGANLRGADFDVIVATGELTWNNTLCPDGTNSDDHGMTCDGHMEGEVHFSVIGDFGYDDYHSPVAHGLVTPLSPDFIVTVGDNTYLANAPTEEHFDESVGDFYSDYILDGDFYPSLGNHDASRGIFGFAAATAEFRSYFPQVFSSTETYYDVRRGPVHLFVVDNERLLQDHRVLCDQFDTTPPYCPSNPARRVTVANQFSGPQDDWLQQELAASDASWKVVVMHHAPYSSGAEHGSQPLQQWDFAAWGADAVFAGHEHIYERLFPADGIPYFVVGTSGSDLRCVDSDTGARVSSFQSTLLAESRAHHGCDPADPATDAGARGAMDVHATPDQIMFRYRTADGTFVDTCTINSDGSTSSDPCSIGSPPPAGFTAFNDLAWGPTDLSAPDGPFQPNANLTLITPGGEVAAHTSGELLDRATGSDTDVVLSVVGGNFDELDEAISAGRAPQGSDADAVFGGFLDTMGAVRGSANPAIDLLLSFDGLDPEDRYELVLYGDLDTGGWDGASLVSIEGADAFRNDSSTGVDDNGAPVFSGPADPSTRVASDNAAGRVVRFVDVASGSDGQVVIRAAADGSAPGATPFANAVMLRTVPAPTVVALVAGSTAPPVGDRPVVQRLESLGHQVRVIDDDALTAESVADADLILVSSSVVISKVPAWLASVPIPVVNNEAYASAVLGLGANAREIGGQSSLDIVSTGPAAAGLTGRPTVAAAGSIFGSVVAEADGEVVATLPFRSLRAAIVLFEAGDELITGPAPAKRAGFFLAYSTPAKLNAAGWSLFDAVVDWGLN